MYRVQTGMVLCVERHCYYIFVSYFIYSAPLKNNSRVHAQHNQ